MTNGTNDAREFDIIIQGATGFTGTLVAEYLLKTYGVDNELRWALAGRSEEKLRQVRDALGAEAKGLEIIVADSFDDEALQSLASRTRVVLTTVGPYALYGSNLVAACVEAGTHYCDLAGEVQWIRKMVDTHHERAQQTGAKIVHCCGFDSIPMDIGVWALQDAVHTKYGSFCESISMLVKATKGTASGGTLASMMNLIKESREDRNVARILIHPYSLNPEGEREGPDERDQQNVVFSEEVNAWTAPFVMAGVNTKIVRRSHALAGYPYGKDFRYSEAVMTGRGFSGWMGGTAMQLGLGGIVLLAAFSPTRKLLQRFVLAKPGEGPDREMQESGFFNLMQVGELADGTIVHGKITGDRDPGYGSTSKMLSESAVCLAKDKLPDGGGVLTPASAMARPLLKRLREKAGLSFELLD